MEQSTPPSVPMRISLTFIGYLLFLLRCIFLLRRKLILSFLSGSSSKVSITPRPSAIYLMICNALPSNFIGASKTTCSARIIFNYYFNMLLYHLIQHVVFFQNASTKAFSLSNAFTHSMISLFICEVYGRNDQLT